ncbi:MAG: hypothetical protein DA408_09150 [Bacteroidetes bacterium]|nr:MAG: hypothetical protein C7N36_01965 [Bacteroidota bacterium]PTM12763.1 MAG: hypothetical protein DA408_09150 [Bacteroidota bacterium]
MPEITEVFYPRTRSDWRTWLANHYQTKTEVWLQLFRKDSGRPTLAYDDLVEECLCFGWIDGVVKKYDADSRVQRITPRRKKSFLSELNRQRVWKLQHQGLLLPGADAMIQDQIGDPADPLVIPDWIAERLREDDQVWAQFQAFSHFYQRLKVGWIAESGLRMEVARQRLDYLVRMTSQGKQYGTQPLRGLFY